jgi:hypothetical protein
VAIEGKGGKFVPPRDTHICLNFRGEKIAQEKGNEAHSARAMAGKLFSIVAVLAVIANGTANAACSRREYLIRTADEFKAAVINARAGDTLRLYAGS